MAIVPDVPGCTMQRVPSSPYVICLGDAEHAELESLSRRATAPFRLVVRARVVLLAADDVANCAIAERLGICEDTARKWRRRYCEQGIEGWPTPRDSHVAVKAGRVLDLYQREWEGQPPGEDEYVPRADEKPGVQPGCASTCPPTWFAASSPSPITGAKATPTQTSRPGDAPDRRLVPCPRSSNQPRRRRTIRCHPGIYSACLITVTMQSSQ